MILVDQIPSNAIQSYRTAFSLEVSGTGAERGRAGDAFLRNATQSSPSLEASGTEARRGYAGDAFLRNAVQSSLMNHFITRSLRY